MWGRMFFSTGCGLTGTYVTVSNYPGTTVEVFRGKGKLGGEIFEVIDTPGMNSFLPSTEEERVARSILLKERPSIPLRGRCQEPTALSPESKGGLR